MDAWYDARALGLKPSPVGWEMASVLLDFLESAWTRPNQGFWEVRGPRRHFTHSKVMAWAAIDREAVENFGRDGPVERWRALRAAIHGPVCREGYDPELASFVQDYGSKDLDASLLLIPLVGFLPPADPQVRGTVAAVERYLVRDGFVQRYLSRPAVDGLPEGEGAFLACTFRLADNLILLGRLDDARATFERLLALRNDVGLLSEKFDPQAGHLVGNFPQTFSHVGLVNTAMNLSPAPGSVDQRPKS
jgi:GH15 family glucan-1,4-alpha-glucosidase